MAASGLTGSTSKHLSPAVTMSAIDSMSWESKNGSINNSSSGGKTLPPPSVITASSVPPPIAQPSNSPIDDLPSPVIQIQHSPPQRPLNQSNKENSWTSNGNLSSSGSISTSASSPRPSQPSTANLASKTNNVKGLINEMNDNYYSNKYPTQRNNYLKSIDNQPYSPKSSVHSSTREVSDSPPPGNSSEDGNHPVLKKLCVENDYNPNEFDLNPINARFFIIKSYSEDDVHRSIKYSIWCSTEHGNKRLDTAFRQQQDKGPIYLFYSVNRSGRFFSVFSLFDSSFSFNRSFLWYSSNDVACRL